MGFHIALTTQTIATTHSNAAEVVIVAGKCSLSGDWGESFDRIGDSLGEFAGLVWGSLRDLPGEAGIDRRRWGFRGILENRD